MGQSAADRLREVADRLEAKGEELKDQAKAGLGKAIARLEEIADKIEAGKEDEIENGEEPPTATQLPA